MPNCPKCGASCTADSEVYREWSCGSYAPRGVLNQSDKCRNREALAFARRFAQPGVVTEIHGPMNRIVDILSGEGREYR